MVLAGDMEMNPGPRFQYGFNMQKVLLGIG